MLSFLRAIKSAHFTLQAVGRWQLMLLIKLANCSKCLSFNNIHHHLHIPGIKSSIFTYVSRAFQLLDSARLGYRLLTRAIL